MDIKIEYDKLKRAIERSPNMVKDKTNVFLIRAQAVLKQGINQSPWRIGGSGGGVPSATTNLKKSHEYKLAPFSLTVAVNESRASYAKYVHGIDGYVRKRSYQLRPWLRYVEKQSENRINSYAKSLLEDIVKDLAQ